MRILIVDDHDVVRIGFRQILSEHPRFVVAAEAGTAADALEALRHGKFDVVLLDLSLPDGSGIDLIREVHQQYPEAVLIVTTVYDDDDNLMRAMAAGADSYLLKDRPSAELSELLRRIGQGEARLSPPMARRHAGSVPQPCQLYDRRDRSSARMGRARTAADPARKRGSGDDLARAEAGRGRQGARNIGTNRRHHVKAVYRKLGINSRAEAAMGAVRRKLA